MKKFAVKSNVLALALFFLVGICGFIYEIVWVHLIGLKMENTAYSQAMTLTVFISGIALGGLVSSRYADHLKNPLRVFSVLTAGVSLFAILSPWVINLTEPVFAFLYRGYGSSFYIVNSLRFIVCGLILILPAGLIGAALPVLISWLVRKTRGSGFAGASLYGWGGMGAATGTVLSGFVLLPELGYHQTLYLTGAVNLALAIIVMRLASSEKPGEVASFIDDVPLPSNGLPGYEPLERKNLILVLLLLTGLCIMIYEISVFRALILIFDSTIHTHGMILSASIFSIALGSLLSPFLRKLVKDRLLITSAMLLLLGVSMLLGATVIGVLPVPAVKAAFQYHDSFITYRLIQFLFMLAVLLIPCMVVGGVFAFAGRMYMRNARSVGHDLGIIYFVNAAGLVTGFTVGAFVMFSFLGIRDTVLVAALISMLTGGFALSFSRLQPIARSAAIVSSVLVLPPLFVLVPSWDNDIMSSGASVYAREYAEKGLDSGSITEEIKRKNSVLYYKEGSVSTVSVTKSDDGALSLKVDGSTEGSTRGSALLIQDLLSDLALMLHSAPEDILLVGLGSGMPLNAVTSHPVRSIDCVEVSKEVVEASEYFRLVNKEALLDPRVNLLPVDGRTHLAFSEKKYDVIISTPSEPWVYGTTSYFTREYFVETSQSLNPGGVMVQWINGNRLSEYDFRVIIRTFLDAYPNAWLWEIDRDEGYYLLMGSESRLSLNYERMKERMQFEGVIHDLEMGGITELPTLLSFFAMDVLGLRVYAKGVEVNTDDNALLEFSAAKDVITAAASPIRHNIEDFRGPPFSLITKITQDELDEVTAAYMAGTFIRKAEDLTEKGEPEGALAELRRALETTPDSKDTARLSARQYVRIGRLSVDLDFSIETFKRAVTLDHGQADGWFYLGSAYYFQERYDEAIEAFREAVRLKPQSPRTHESLAISYQALGYTETANEEHELSEKLRHAVYIAM